MSISKKHAAPRNLDEEMRQLLVEIRMLEGSARVLSSRLDIVTGALSETQTAKQTLEGSIKDLNIRATDLDKARINVTQQLNQIINQTEDYRARLEDLARRKGGGPVELV